LAGVGLERQHSPRPVVGTRQTPGFIDHRLVAFVDAVKIADGDGRASEAGRQVFEISVYLHRGWKMSARLEPVKTQAQGC